MQSNLLCLISPLHTEHFSRRCDEEGEGQSNRQVWCLQTPAQGHMEVQQAPAVSQITEMCVCGGSHLNDFLKSEHS